jgi:alanyl-tRNA synthetase
MPVAERLYYDDSSLRTFTAQVTDIREYARTDGQSQWQIALDRTAFYPNSGGQPNDCGTLAATARSGAELLAEIDDVVEDDDGEVWHSTRKPLLAGTEVTGTIDWPRRLDHMQQHSGQHLLSAIFYEELGARTVSFHLGETVCSVDLAVESPDQQAALLEALPRIEQRVNQHIAENLPVSTRTVSSEQAQALLAAGQVRKLPPRAGSIRLIEIPTLDLNACGGTHVRSLGEIGTLLLRSTERVKKSLRVEFVCGQRAVAAARLDFATLSAAAASLSVKRDDLPAAVERLLAESKSSAKAQQRLREELAHHQAVQLAVEERIERGLRLVRRSFANRDADYVKLLASRLVASVPQTVAIFLSTMEEPAALVLACSKSLACECGDRLRHALAPLGLRGGGSQDMAQTLIPRAQAEQVAALLAEQFATDLRLPLVHAAAAVASPRE